MDSSFEYKMRMSEEKNVIVHGREGVLLAVVAFHYLFPLAYVVYLMLIDG